MLKNRDPLLGAHMSISGGIHQALFRGKAAGCKVIQIFTRNPNQWASKALSQCEIDRFLNAVAETDIQPVASHDSYLINLASPHSDLREKSVRALVDELDRAGTLRIPYLVIHPGAHMGEGVIAGLGHVIDSLNRVLDASFQAGVMVLLETTAGQGTHLGHRFEHLAEVMDGVESPGRLGICLDTAHIFAAGYDIGEAQDYIKMLQAFDATIGLDHLKLIHVNDSKTPFGSKVDRHQHIGKGFIGEKAFSFFLKDSALKHLPFILETPKGERGEAAMRDKENLITLRKLMER
jgi:deoxyribonuclease-4